MHEALSMTTIGNPFGPSPIVTEMREQILSEAIGVDTREAEQLLKLKISEWLGVPPDMIGLGNGSSELISRISSLYVAHHSLVIPVPTYFGIVLEALRNGATICPVVAGTEQEFDLNSIALELVEKLRATPDRVLWLCNPNNPSGRSFQRETIHTLIEANPGMTIVDEAYQEALGDGATSSVISLVQDNENILVTKTFSKAFGLASLKVGFVIGHPRHINAIEANRSPLSLDQALAARFALDDLEHVQHYASWLRQELGTFYQTLSTLPHVSVSPLSQAGMLLLRNVTESTENYLRERNIVARPANQELGIDGEDYVRVGLQQSSINQEFLKRLVV